MSTLSQFVGGQRPPKTLVNATSSDGASLSAFGLYIDSQAAGLKIVTSGTLSAGVLTPVLSVSGGGSIPAFFASSPDATSRTHRLKLTIDGVVVYDFTTAAVAAVNKGVLLIGYQFNYSGPAMPDPVHFNSSLLIEYASSLTETNKTNFAYVYKTY